MNDPVDFIISRLRDNADTLKTLGDELIEQIESEVRAIYGGAEWYILRKKNLTPKEQADRNNQIRREFNGQNLKAICKRYEVSRTTVYRVARRGNG